MEELVRTVDGDEEYLKREYQNMSKSRPVIMQDFAQYLSTLFPAQRAPTRWDLEAMLKAYGEDRYGAEGALDIVEFARAFCKLREQRGIPAGLYRPSRSVQDSSDPRQRDGPGQSINNPLLPGRSAT